MDSQVDRSQAQDAAPPADQVAREAVEVIWPGQGAVVEVLSGGLTNANFKITVGSEQFALRVQSQNAGVLDINREAEEAAARLSAVVGVGPEVVASLPERNVLVTRFVHGRMPEVAEMREPGVIDRVAKLFRTLHDSTQSIPGEFDPFSVCRKYGELLREQGLHGGPAHALGERLAARIEAAVDFEYKVPSHCDAAWLNFIEGDDGKLWLIDWEYAGMSDWKQDLSDVSGFHDYGPEEDRRLVEAYWGEARDEDVSAIRVMRFMIIYRCAVWGLMQQAHGDLDEDYTAWTDEWFEKTADYGGSSDFLEHLERLEAARGAGR